MSKIGYFKNLMEYSNDNNEESYVNEYAETQGFYPNRQVRTMNQHKNTLDYIHLSSDSY